MPDLVKIGRTSQSEVSTRISQLYSTGVPLPFECDRAVTVDDAQQAAKAIHMAFAPSRLNPHREFFRIKPEQVIAILDLIKAEDVTPGVRIGNSLLNSSHVSLIHVDEPLLLEAWSYFTRHHDKRYSLTDCVSFVVMIESGIQTAYAFDRDFIQAGFTIEPIQV